jgi:hypothetical protein
MNSKTLNIILFAIIIGLIYFGFGRATEPTIDYSKELAQLEVYKDSTWQLLAERDSLRAISERKTLTIQKISAQKSKVYEVLQTRKAVVVDSVETLPAKSQISYFENWIGKGEAYPKTLVPTIGDSLIGITPFQLAIINSKKAQLDFSLQEVDLLKDLLKLSHKEIYELNPHLSVGKRQEKDLKAIISASEKQLDLKNLEKIQIQTELRKVKRQRRFIVISGVVAGVLVVVKQIGK